MKSGRFGFHKSERLCSKKSIERLFAGGSHSVSAYPLRAVYRTLSEEEKNPAKEGCATNVAVLISVSKRHFKHAVDRNRTKRLIREAYRLNREILVSQLQDKNLNIAFIWMSDALSDFATVEAKVKNLLQRIAENLKE